MLNSPVLPLLALIGLAQSQQAHPKGTEVHPTIRTQVCTKTECKPQDSFLVLEQNERGIFAMSAPDGSVSCIKDGTFDATLCPDPDTCAKNCGLGGADYAARGITTQKDVLSMKMTKQTSTNANGYSLQGSRLYLLKDNTTYQPFMLKNQEFTYDVDVSKLPCGINGNLYFVAMAANGGNNYTGNTAGAARGTGYCDAQCGRNPMFINGKANLNDPKTKQPAMGACCTQSDIWEANRMVTVMKPHNCNITTLSVCTDAASCGEGDGRNYGMCDKGGCDFNSYRNGNKDFYGMSTASAGAMKPMKRDDAKPPPPTNVGISAATAVTMVDTMRPFTVVTQYVTKDNTAAGDLSEIKRFYVQDGKVIPNPMSTVAGMDPANSITDGYCAAIGKLFHEGDGSALRGGLKGHGKAFEAGMVLTMSLWDDPGLNMNWLDSTFGNETAEVSPGQARGPCNIYEGNPLVAEKLMPDAQITYGNFRWGELGSTFGPTAAKGALDGGLPGTGAAAHAM